MAGGGGVNRRISAASARAHTRKSKQKSVFNLPTGIFRNVLLLLLVGFVSWAFQAVRPPAPKICGTPGGPPVTAARVKLSDGRHLAYKESGVPKDKAKHKIILVHGFDSYRNDDVLAASISPELVENLGIYFVSFDRPGYGESDPDPNGSVKSIALDIERLADQLGLGPKFHVIGFSMGGQLVWGCLKYIPHRLKGATLLAPGVNYWWSGVPEDLSAEAYQQKLRQDQWAIRVAHYAPWLTHWWNTQKWFPVFSIIAHSTDILSSQDKDIKIKRLSSEKVVSREPVRQQGEYGSIHRDLNIGFGKWDFCPTNITNPFLNNEGTVHLWHGDEDLIVSCSLNHYIAKQLPWIRFHEIPGAGHFFPYTPGMSDAIIKAQLSVE